MTSSDLLSGAERAELRRATAGVLALVPPDRREALRASCAEAAGSAYLEGQVAGLCRDGAIEVASDAARAVLGHGDIGG